MRQVISTPFLTKYDFRIKQPMKTDIPLSKEPKSS